jgi:hypothetical protein
MLPEPTSPAESSTKNDAMKIEKDDETSTLLTMSVAITP